MYFYCKLFGHLHLISSQHLYNGKITAITNCCVSIICTHLPETNHIISDYSYWLTAQCRKHLSAFLLLKYFKAHTWLWSSIKILLQEWHGIDDSRVSWRVNILSGWKFSRWTTEAEQAGGEIKLSRIFKVKYLRRLSIENARDECKYHFFKSWL